MLSDANQDHPGVYFGPWAYYTNIEMSLYINTVYIVGTRNTYNTRLALNITQPLIISLMVELVH